MFVQSPLQAKYQLNNQLFVRRNCYTDLWLNGTQFIGQVARSKHIYCLELLFLAITFNLKIYVSWIYYNSLSRMSFDAHFHKITVIQRQYTALTLSDVTVYLRLVSYIGYTIWWYDWQRHKLTTCSSL